MAEPVTDVDPRFSAPGAEPTPWADAEAELARAEVSWLSTVRADGRPHVTTLMTVWADGALHFCTGRREQKARNLAANPRVALTTGTNSFAEGLDLVVEGEAVRVADEARLRRLADRWHDKYGGDWRFEVRDGCFWSAEGGEAPVFAVRPVTVFGFRKGDAGAQVRWRFGATGGPAPAG